VRPSLEGAVAGSRGVDPSNGVLRKQLDRDRLRRGTSLVSQQVDLSLQAADPARAGAAWAAVDRQIVDQAPAIGLLVLQEVDLVSGPVGKYQHNPVWGTILSQLWVA
jgi:hypothetical protein